MKMKLRKREINFSKTMGLALLGLSIFTAMGGIRLVGDVFYASAGSNAVRIYLLDAATEQPIAETYGEAKELVEVRVTGFRYMGVDYPLSAACDPSYTAPIYWGFTSTLPTTYYVTITAEGYHSTTGEVTLPPNYIQEYTFRLHRDTGDPEPDPMPPDIGEPPLPWPAEVYVNEDRVNQGDIVSVNEATVEFRVVITEELAAGMTEEAGYQVPLVEAVYAVVDGDTFYLELGEDVEASLVQVTKTYTGAYTLPEKAAYEARLGVLDTLGGDTPLMGFTLAYGVHVAYPSGSVDEALDESMERSNVLMAGCLAAMGAGLYLLGSIEEGKRR